MCFCASPSQGFPSKVSKPASSKSMHTAFLITKTFAAVDGGAGAAAADDEAASDDAAAAGDDVLAEDWPARNPTANWIDIKSNPAAFPADRRSLCAFAASAAFLASAAFSAWATI